MSDDDMKPPQFWRDLATQAIQETDSTKLATIVQELCKALDQVRLDQVRLDQVRLDQVRLDQARPYPSRLDPACAEKDALNVPVKDGKP